MADATTTTTTTAPANGATEPFYKDWLSSDGKLNAAAYDRLPPDIAYLKPSLEKYPTAEDLFRGFAYNQSAAGKKGLIPLPDNAPPEVRAERKAMLDQLNGVPKEFKDYGLTKPEGFGDDEWSQPLADNWAKWCQENSVNPAAARKFLSEVQVPAIKAAKDAQRGEVEGYWRKQDETFDAAVRQQNIPREKADKLVEISAVKLGFDLSKNEDKMALKNATTRMAMVKYAIATGEDSFINGEAKPGGDSDPMGKALSAANNKSDPLYEPLHDPRHPQHKQAKEQVDQWFRAAQAQSNRR